MLYKGNLGSKANLRWRKQVRSVYVVKVEWRRNCSYCNPSSWLFCHWWKTKISKLNVDLESNGVNLKVKHILKDYLNCQVIEDKGFKIRTRGLVFHNCLLVIQNTESPWFVKQQSGICQNFWVYKCDQIYVSLSSRYQFDQVEIIVIS
jgi:hypothetical protein